MIEIFGDRKNLKKREPKEERISERKLIEKKESTNNNSTSNNNTSGSNDNLVGILGLIITLISNLFKSSNSKKNKKGKGCGCLIIIIISAIVVFLILSLNLSNLFVSYDIGVDEEGVKTNVNSESGYLWLKKDNIPNPKKSYTVMMYINGSDLESNHGLASGDILEMMESGFNEDNVNILLLTGGTSDWKSESMSKDLTIYQLKNDKLIKTANLGNKTIADKDLLTNYIDYCAETFPADKYGFIFWNHGGGTLYGYGSDENFNGASLSISQISEGFRNSSKNNKGFEFIGFDCCLMATMETAELVSPYANYFIASAELEPGTGWDYSFFKNLSDNPRCTGEEIGKHIVDLYIKSNSNTNYKTEATLSVVDLSKVANLVTSVDKLGYVAENEIKKGNFDTISRARKNTKSFGNISEDSSFDLIDIGHLATNMKELFPNESNDVINNLTDCVVYNKNTNFVKNSNGLTTYIPYVSKKMANDGVVRYSKLNKFPNFTQFLFSFSEKLTSQKITKSYVEETVPERIDGDIGIRLTQEQLKSINKINFVIWKQMDSESDFFIRLGLSSNVDIKNDGAVTTKFDGYWNTLNGQNVCIYEVERNEDFIKCFIPAVLNGEDVNLVIMFDEENPNGNVLGALPFSQKDVAPKYFIKISNGDKISLKYYAQLFLKNESYANKYSEIEKWIKGKEFTVNGKLEIDLQPVDDEIYMYGFWIEDIYNNRYYTDFIEVRY